MDMVLCFMLLARLLVIMNLTIAESNTFTTIKNVHAFRRHVHVVNLYNRSNTLPGTAQHHEHTFGYWWTELAGFHTRTQ